MSKRIAILVRAGLPYRKTILYGCERAREMSAKLVLVGVIPELDDSRKASLAIHEFSPYEAIAQRLEQETNEFLDRAVQFCLDSEIIVEKRIEHGGMEKVIEKIIENANFKLVVVPTPTKKEHHSEFLDAIKHFAHDILDQKPRCPVVSVLAT